jgi:hypothetical protein
MRVMGISRQSMYDTFGDKRTLFLQALELSVMESVRSTQAELKKAERITTPKGEIVRQGLKIRFFPVRAGHRVPKTERTRAETLEADRVRK